MDPRLRAPALKGDVEALTTALNEGADPNRRDEDGYAPLLYAASNGHARCIDVLRRHGADVNAAARCGRTPLNTAAAGGHTEAIKILIKAGAMVDWRESWNGSSFATALHWAARLGTASAVQALLKAGADVDADNATRRVVRAVTLANVASDEASSSEDEDEEVQDDDSAVESVGSSIRLEVVRGSFTPLDEAVRRFGSKPNRVIPTLVAAGCTIKLEHAETVPYLRQVLECGGFAQYERAHRRRLAWILGRGTRVPAELLPTIIDFWAHVGWYAVPNLRPGS